MLYKMETNKLYKPNAIDLILGKGVINEDSHIQDVAVMYFNRYRIVAEAAYLNNIGLFVPSIRTIAYNPKNIIILNGAYTMITTNRKKLHSYLINFGDKDYYKVLEITIEIVRLYLLKVIIYQDNDEVLGLIKANDYYNKIIGLIDVMDDPITSRYIRDRIIDEVNYTYINGSIIDLLTEYIKTNGYE